MGSQSYHVLFWLVLLCSPRSAQDIYAMPSDDWESQKPTKDNPPSRCQEIKPTARDIVRRIYAILPYLDREHDNAQFIQKYRATINMMSEADDILDREAAFYIAVLTPIIFLQHYRDTWCLFERVRSFINILPRQRHPTLAPQEFTDEDGKDKKDIRFLKELIKNLG